MWCLYSCCPNLSSTLCEQELCKGSTSKVTTEARWWQRYKHRQQCLICSGHAITAQVTLTDFGPDPQTEVLQSFLGGPALRLPPSSPMLLSPGQTKATLQPGWELGRVKGDG